MTTFYLAANVADTDAGRPLIAPSPIMSRLSRETPKQMTIGEIDEMIEAHGTAAARVRKGGLDGVELLSAFGYLPAAFLSPYSNTRSGDYGGSLENRMRFLLRTIDAVRAGVGRDRILGVRIPGDEQVADGLAPSDLQDIAALIAQTGQIDYLNIIVGTNYDRAGRMDHWPPRPRRTVCSCRWQLELNPAWPCLSSPREGSLILRWPTASSNAAMPAW